MKRIRVALAGNPNVGKTTIFNALTGSRKHVGNWPGKTVERIEGISRHGGSEFSITDLPGTYSLTAYSAEEIIARDYVVDEKPDVVVHVIDASGLERNLYLTLQLMELGANVVIALNMKDVAGRRGFRINVNKMSKLLGVPVVPTQANRKRGLNDLMETVKERSFASRRKNRIKYGKELEDHIEAVEKALKKVDLPGKYRPRWMAIKLLENDSQAVKTASLSSQSMKLFAEVEKNRKHLREVFGEEVDTAIAEGRYGFISGLFREAVKKEEPRRERAAERLDSIATNRITGIPLFLFFMWLTFFMTFTVAAPLADSIDFLFSGLLSDAAVSLLSSLSAPAVVMSFVVDGIIGGVGSVIVFVPFIGMLFFMISILEDSGYMARAAFVMDELMHRIGLHGKSFLPLLMGFGCTVPACMAARTLDNKKDRIQTILLTPFMSCGARLAVYVFFAAAFFPGIADLVVFSLYILVIAVAVISGFIFRKTIFKGPSTPFVMELPAYKLPTMKGALIHTWENVRMFVKKAGTFIFAAVVVIWLLGSLPPGVDYASEQSFAGIIGKAVSPALAPLGFGNWQSGVALIFGGLAKEAVIGTFGALQGAGSEAGIMTGLQQLFTPLSAFSFLVFVLLYFPCVASVAVIRKEAGARWALFSVTYTTAAAWIASFIVYNTGLLLGFV